MDQMTDTPEVTEVKRRGRKPNAEKVAQVADDVPSQSPAYLVQIPEYIHDVPLNEQCPMDIVLAFRSLLGVVCSFKAGHLVCIDGRKFRASVADGKVEVYE